MADRRRIVLYGNSIVLGSVGASLERSREFELVHLVTPLPSEELEALAPDVILFDIENGHADAAFALLETRSDLLLLGISPDGNVLRHWSGRQYPELTTKDLTALIQGALQPDAVPDERLETHHDVTAEG